MNRMKFVFPIVILVLFLLDYILNDTIFLLVKNSSFLGDGRVELSTFITGVISAFLNSGFIIVVFIWFRKQRYILLLAIADLLVKIGILIYLFNVYWNSVSGVDYTNLITVILSIFAIIYLMVIIVIVVKLDSSKLIKVLFGFVGVATVMYNAFDIYDFWTSTLIEVLGDYISYVDIIEGIFSVQMFYRTIQVLMYSFFLYFLVNEDDVISF